MGSRNWFQVHRNSRIASDMIAGRASGTWISQNCCQALAPSISAASHISLGTFTKCARIQ